MGNNKSCLNYNGGSVYGSGNNFITSDGPIMVNINETKPNGLKSF